MAKKKKKQRKTGKKRLPKTTYQLPRSQIRPLKAWGAQRYLENARDYPILGCWKYAGLEEHGIGPVVVARKQSEERVFFGVYLLDIWCLGVKNAYVRVDVSLRKFHRWLPDLCSGEPEACSVEYAHELVYGAMEYAERYGFKPHPDFTRLKADRILDPPEMHPRSGKITFGKDGKPFFVSGPRDDLARSRRILDTLERTAGEGNYDYIVTIDDLSELTA